MGEVLKLSVAGLFDCGSAEKLIWILSVDFGRSFRGV